MVYMCPRQRYHTISPPSSSLLATCNLFTLLRLHYAIYSTSKLNKLIPHIWSTLLLITIISVQRYNHCSHQRSSLSFHLPLPPYLFSWSLHFIFLGMFYTPASRGPPPSHPPYILYSPLHLYHSPTHIL